MKNLKKKLALLLLMASMLPAVSSYGASFSISVSDSISSSLTAISDSLGKSSKGSSNAVKTAQGDYKITDIAAADGPHNRMKLALRAPGEDREKDLYLYLPVDDYNRSNLGVGQIVKAVPQEYGVAFFQELTKQPFAVVLADNWIKDLNPNPVS